MNLAQLEMRMLQELRGLYVSCEGMANGHVTKRCPCCNSSLEDVKKSIAELDAAITKRSATSQ